MSGNIFRRDDERPSMEDLVAIFHPNAINTSIASENIFGRDDEHPMMEDLISIYHPEKPDCIEDLSVVREAVWNGTLMQQSHGKNV